MCRDARIHKILITIIGIGGILVPIVMIAWILYFKPLHDKKPAASRHVAGSGLETQQGLERRDATVQTSEYTNPFLSPLKKKSAAELIFPAPKGLTLEGIIAQPERTAALVNDMIVRTGDTIDGKTIVEIKDKSVVLKDTDYHYILNFEEE